MILKVGLTVTALAALAACSSGVPAGGVGPFDPPPPARLDPLPPRTAAPITPQPLPPEGQVPEGAAGAPRSVAGVPPDPNAALARDVTAALAATAPGTVQPSTQTQIPAPAATAPLPTPSAPAQNGTATAAAPGAAPLPGASEIGIDPGAESINLSLSTQEEQKRQRDAAQRRREAAQERLVVIDPEPVPQTDVNANVVRFARETSHPVGTKQYARPRFRDRLQARSNCRRFDTSDEAQRQFLANGGPQTDRFNLDPDGDGFACSFDPERYRQLRF